jgi:hypothetical protein
MSESFERSRIVARSLKWQCEDANVKIVKNISVKCLGFPFFLFFFAPTIRVVFIYAYCSIWLEIILQILIS